MTETGARPRPPRILAFAPACNPERGSEGGVGWWWSRVAAGLGETWVLTRPRNREAIERALPGTPERDRLRFVYVDVGWWPRRSRRGKGRGSIDYLVWQPAALREARRLHASVGFDLVWHLTFANAWLGSAAGLLGPPFVYGPVGGGVANPWRLLPWHGARGAGYELARAAGRAAGRWANPLARVAWSRADLILAQNPETRGWLPARHRARVRVCPNPVLDERLVERIASAPRSPTAPSTALYAGRLVAWKGMFLALRVLRALPSWRLVVCGKGPDEARLRRLARRLGVEDRVEFRGFVPRSELLRTMREADVLLFPSLHEEAGWVVAEAAACGLPVVCVRRGGPPVIGGHGVEIGSLHETVDRLREAVERAAASGGDPGGDAARWTLPARRAEVAAALAEVTPLLADDRPDSPPGDSRGDRERAPVDAPVGPRDRAAGLRGGGGAGA